MTSRSRVDDMVVIVPGILGRRPADAEGREVRGLSGPALLRGIRTYGRSVKGLTLPPDLGNEHPGDGVRPLGPMRDLHGLLGIPGHDRVAVCATAGNGPVRTLNNLGGGRCPARLTGLPTGPHRVRVSTGNAGHVVMTALVLVQESGSDDGE
ncbi:hypothetical protein [Streptomyces sp. NBC_01435]|uniref:hypothetical protein n=1 Tax=Streptomyces sp. NBC_01435 TaxID=2903865 RepID=UPI002E30044F|nr:hypothetical protein [Streptomyces sp. NBC_01435]